MTNDENQKAQEAAELAKSAGKDTANAGKKALKAVQTGADAATDAVADEAQDIANKAHDTAEDAVQAARKIDVGVLSKISGDTGIGFLALSVSIYAGAVAFAKFRQAASGRTRVLKP